MPLSNTSNTPTVLDSSSVLFPCGDWFLRTLRQLVFVDRLTSAGCREHVVRLMKASHVHIVRGYLTVITAGVSSQCNTASGGPAVVALPNPTS